VLAWGMIEELPEETWEAWIEAGWQEIKAEHRAQIFNVAILLEDEPSEAVRLAERLADGETLLGLYHGIPLTERGVDYGVGETLPDTITLYKNPIRAEARETDADIARVVRETLWHEFGHYFGLDEDSVRAREAKRFGRAK
jgi:predicted Zn-dependent protease with MMP-like domain